MKNRRIQFVLLALAVVLGWLLRDLRLEQAVHAASNLSIPKAYGTFKGTGMGSLVFESADGTIRVVDPDGLVTLTAKRN